MRERELKLALPGRFALPPLTLGGETLSTATRPELTLRATYYDTHDLRLARHGATLRYRTGDVAGPTWTLKLPVSATSAELVRNELHFDGTRREPPAEVRSLVTAYARLEPLMAVATLRTKRRRVTLLRAGIAVAEVDDDEVSVVEGRRVVSRFRELEVEALQDEVQLGELAEQLHRAGATDAEPIPKVVRALGSRATAPADVAGARLPPSPTMADALAASLADAGQRLVHHDPLARLGEPEGVHQVRVALRRLRSDLLTLGDAVDPVWRTGIEAQLRVLADALAEARELDVLDVSLRADGADAEAALRPLLDELEHRRLRAGTAVRAALDDPSYPRLLDLLIAAAATPPVGPGASAPAAERLPELVLAAWRRLERRADDLDRDRPDSDFHRARIAAKRTRYAAELAARVLPEVAAGAEMLAKKVSAVQDRLGAIQDASVAERTIREALAVAGSDPAYAFEAGRLVERQRGRAMDARHAFLERWPSVRRPRWRKWAT